MSDLSPDGFAALNARSQENLIEYLNLDLDLASAFLETARIETGSYAKHGKSAVEKARNALASIRKFQRHVEDPGELVKINDRANQLEAAINGFGRDRIMARFRAGPFLPPTPERVKRCTRSSISGIRTRRSLSWWRS
jgi:hypothetical protein